MFATNPPLHCPCGSFVDPYGDHLLGCGQGPLQIQRHNALRDVSWRALLQDNRETRREQRFDGTSLECPDDILHPTFMDGRPTYFDVSVTNTLQPGNLNRSLSHAGVAAMEAELKKDVKYDQHVWDHGGRFAPLIVESLGLWSPFAISMLRSIAERTTLFNGLDRAKAFVNLLEQLSITLWSYNARMIVSRFHISPDPLWDIPT